MKILLTALITLTLSGAATAFAQQAAQTPQGQLQSDGTYAQAPGQAASGQAAPGQAQQPMQGKPHNPAKEAKHLSKQLSLTPDQSSQVQTLFADRDTRVAALHSDTTIDPKAMHKQMHQIQQDTNVKLIALLTPAQQQLYSDMKAAHKHQGPPAGAPMPPPNA